MTIFKNKIFTNKNASYKCLNAYCNVWSDIIINGEDINDSKNIILKKYML